VWARGESFYFPFRHFEGYNIPGADSRLFDLGELLHNPCMANGEPTSLGGFNYQYDVKMWARDGVRKPVLWEDPILMAHLCNENEVSFKMESLAEKYVNESAGGDEQELLDAIRAKFPSAPKKGIKGLMCYLSGAAVGSYAMQDVETAFDLYMFYIPWLKRQGLWELYKEQRYFAKHVTNMELNGLLLDKERLEVNSVGAVAETARLKKILCDMAGHEVNPNSPKQMQALLRVPSTARDKLEIAYEVANPKIKGAKELLSWRRYKKAEGTYYQPFRELVSVEGRVHPNLRIVGGWQQEGSGGGTVAGRLSAQHPNLQAVTRGTGEKYSSRDVFIASPGYTLLEFDFSQAELRVASHYAKEKTMIEMFRAGIDIHQGVADELGFPRSLAKNVNFSFLYGIGPKAFGEKYFMSFKDARDTLRAYDARFPGFKRLYRKCEAFARKHRYIQMWTGRRRHFNTSRTQPRDAMNNLIQGAVGEMIRRLLVAIGEDIKFFDPELYRACLTVHDSGMAEIIAKLEYIYSRMRRIKQLAEDQPWCSVPIKLDFKKGNRWGSMKEIVLTDV